MFEAIFDDFRINLYKIDRDLKYLCFLPVCSHTHLLCMCIHACMYTHVHMHGDHTQPPLHPQKIWRPKSYWKLRYCTLCHWMQNLKSSCSLGVVVGGGGVWHHQTPPPTTPKLQLDFKSKKSSWSLGVVVGGCLASDPPPPPLNFNLTLS